MRKITLTNDFIRNRTSFENAKAAFIKFCKLKNLTERTIEFYEEDLMYLQNYVNAKYLDEITQETLDDFILEELDKGRRTTTLNTRLRGLRVFFKFCAEREYMEELSIKLLKDDAELKEPYTDAELLKLLARPKSNRWAEYRSWAMINYLVATGNRARTIVNIKISDVNFDENTIHLRAMKNRHQQIIPLSPALKEVLEEYLSSWKWSFDDYLFPSSSGGQLATTSFQQAIRKYNAERGVSKTSIHLFRHTFAKNFILAGGGLVQLQMLMGHSTLDMTRHYVNLYGADLSKDFERLNPLDNIKRAT
jgi:integrase/recombinase XerD